MDLDMLCLDNLEKLINYNDNKFYITYEPKEQTELIYDNPYYICNAFFACEEKNPILKMCNR